MTAYIFPLVPFLLISIIPFLIIISVSFICRMKFKFHLLPTVISVIWMMSLYFLILSSTVFNSNFSRVSLLIHIFGISFILMVSAYFVRKKYEIKVKHGRDITIIILVGILAFTTIGISSYEYKEHKSYDDGLIFVEFHENINETEARTFLESFGFSIKEIFSHPYIKAYLLVPTGLEESYVNILSRYDEVNEVYRVGPE